MIPQKLMNKFPTLPPYHGYWAALYVEPIVLSGERICVAIAAIGADGQCAIADTVNSDIWFFILGKDKGTAIISLIEVVKESLQKHIRSELTFQHWKKPMTGFYLSRASEAQADNLEDILQQGIEMTASFYSKSEK